MKKEINYIHHAKIKYSYIKLDSALKIEGHGQKKD